MAGLPLCRNAITASRISWISANDRPASPTRATNPTTCLSVDARSSASTTPNIVGALPETIRATASSGTYSTRGASKSASRITLDGIHFLPSNAQPTARIAPTRTSAPTAASTRPMIFFRCCIPIGLIPRLRHYRRALAAASRVKTAAVLLFTSVAVPCCGVAPFRRTWFMDLSVLMLSRVQFALTIMFHYLFPPLSIGLGGLLVIMEAMYLKTANPSYEVMAKFWTKIFAVNFAIGVATGIVMEFQFGTNWATYSRYVGDVFGSALAAEGIFAFFLESGFLAVLVFGWDKVSPRTHFFSTCMVALGAFFSSIWIVVANSWQQTPAGYHIVGEGLRARAEITDFWAMVFSPSSMQRLSHTLIGAYILAAFFVMSIAAYYILKGRHLDFAKKSFSIALVVAALASLAAPISGDMQARKVAKTQPAKLAAMEAVFQTGTKPTPLYLFGQPDVTAQRVNYSVRIPGMLSWL